MLSIQSRWEQISNLRAWVLLQVLILDEVQYCICIGLLTCCVAQYIELTGQLVQALEQMRSQVQLYLLRLVLDGLVRDVYRVLEAHVGTVPLIDCMHHRLIDVQNQ